MTSGGTSSVISSSSAVDIRAWAPSVVEVAEAEAAVAEAEAAAEVETVATAAATRASDSFTISFRLSFAFTSETTNFASSLRRVSSKKSSFCSCVIGGTCVAGTCIVAVESGVEEVVPALKSFLGGIVASL